MDYISLYCQDLFRHNLEFYFVNRTRGLEGNIYVNNFPRNLSQFRKLSAYIMQDNQLHANLTVDEAMTVAAKLKIGSKKSKEREEIVRQTLKHTLE